MKLLAPKHYINGLILGFALCTGLVALGAILGFSAIRHKEFERSVTVKGLSEQEFAANIVIWPIEFTLTDNDLNSLYAAMDTSTLMIQNFLQDAGISSAEVTTGIPLVNDSFVNQYRANNEIRFRYSGSRTVTVYTDKVDLVRNARDTLAELGKDGLVLSGDSWRSTPKYLFTGLNKVKPDMVEDATRNAREVAEKFAQDSQSTLGRIRRATQGQFSISDRDVSTPHIKTVRVVSTIEYYLAD